MAKAAVRKAPRTPISTKRAAPAKKIELEAATNYVEPPVGSGPVDVFVAFVAKYRHDPVAFAREVLNFEPLPWQEEFLKAIAAGKHRISIRAGHGVGKSGVCAVLVVWFMCVRYPQKTVCLSGDVKVLTARGAIPISAVTPSDLVWDGVEWISQDGPVCNGLRETIELAGVRLTPQHEILCGTTWHPAQRLADDESILCRALATASESLPSQALQSASVAELWREAVASSFAAHAAGLSTGRQKVICEGADRRGACSAPSARPSRPASNTSAIAKLWRTTICGLASCAASIASGVAAITRSIRATAVTAAEAFTSGGTSNLALVPSSSGTRPFGGARCSNISSPFRATTSRDWNWTASTTTRATNREIFDSSADDRTREIGAQFGDWNSASANSKRKLPVYDLVNCGPRSRFTILTDRGPLLVHNCTAPAAGQLFDVLYPEIKRRLSELPEAIRGLFETFSDRIELKSDPDKSFLTAKTSSIDRPEAMQGVHSENVLLIFDEASGVPEAVFSAADGSMSGHNAITVLIGNPTRNSGTFFSTHHEMRANWHTMHVSCVGNRLVKPEYIKDVLDRWGEGSNEYRVKVLGEFPLAEYATLIPAELVDAAMVRDVVLDTKEPIVYGVDVARFGDDRSVICKRQGNVVLEIKSQRGLDLMGVTGWVMHEAGLDKPAEICVDSIGLGGGVADRLRELKQNVRDVNVAESSPLNPQAFKLRDELWLSVKDWLNTRAVKLPKDEELRMELVAPTYGYASNGKYKIEDKASMKQRIRKSPDLADALCLTFAGQAAMVGGRAPSWIPGKPLQRNIKGIV